MIIVKISGGLGNQMFQYASGRGIAESLGVDLLLDTSLYENYIMHNGFELPMVFGDDFRIATRRQIKQVIGWRSTRLGRRIMSTGLLRYLKGGRYLVEKDLPETWSLDDFPRNSYLSGYWQSERYFEHCPGLIRRIFQFKAPVDIENSRIVTSIESDRNPVSIHIRRGDYVADAKTNALHGTCSIEYYRQVMRHIEGRIEDPRYYVFSDDIGWAKNNLELPGDSIFVSHNRAEQSYNDMRLMSLCKHNVIANSSFSWWGAWLNGHNGKIVVAPRKWFNDRSIDVARRIPGSWELL